MTQYFKQCPRCQAGSPGLLTVYSCPQCFGACCDDCALKENPELKGHFLPFGYAYRGCPGCRMNLETPHAVGIVQSKSDAELVAEAAEREAKRQASLTDDDRRRMADEQKQFQADVEIRRITDRQSSTSCCLEKKHLHLMPRVAAGRGEEVVFMELTGPTDADLKTLAAHAAKFPTLWNLRIQECPEITDEGLAALAALTTLKDLILAGDLPLLTPAGIAAFRKGARKCKIKGGPSRPWWKFW